MLYEKHCSREEVKDEIVRDQKTSCVVLETWVKVVTVGMEREEKIENNYKDEIGRIWSLVTVVTELEVRLKSP